MSKSKISLIKHTFFNHSSLPNSDFSFSDDDFDLDQLTTEFLTVYQLFLSNKQHWQKCPELVLYMHFICDLLICYYEYDYLGLELEKLKEHKKTIDSFIKEYGLLEKTTTIDPFTILLLERLKFNLPKYNFTFVSLSKLHKEISSLNSKRSQFGYSRALATLAVEYLQSCAVSDLIYELNQLLGNRYSFIEGLNLLNKSRDVMTILGIALFATRLLINLILMTKHLFQAAFSKELSVKKELRQELAKRGFVIASDLVWCLVGFLTTFNNLCNISSLFVPPIILTFLIFDTLLLLGQWFFESTKHQARLQELINQKEGATQLELIMINRQIDLLNDEWEAQCAYYNINILGANILALSFAISMFCSIPLALAGLALCSMLGNALYNTAEEYKKYQQLKIAVNREMTNGLIINNDHHKELLAKLQEECNELHAAFWQSLTFNVGGLAFIITATVVSWPVAVALTVAYVGYQLHKLYQKQFATNHKEITHDVYRFLTPLPEETLPAFTRYHY